MMKALASSSKPESTGTWLSTMLAEDSTIGAASLRICIEHYPGIFSPWVDNSTISLASLCLASHWLETCLAQHRVCATGEPSLTFSARFIDVSRTTHLRLTSKAMLTEAYVTLSYEWGKGNRFVTTKENVIQHEACIPLDELPATFQDAIRVSRLLGYRFIWIDALCIIQDSEEDKGHQIARMDQIFRCSSLTLFAAAGPVPTSLGIQRDSRHVKPCRLDLQTSWEGRTWHRSAYVVVDRNVYQADWTYQPLFKRGWVAQEQILAPRALIFGPRELAWRCICGHASESRPKQRGETRDVSELDIGPPDTNEQRYFAGVDQFDLLRLFLSHKSPLPERTGLSRYNHFDEWYKFIAHYNRRDLTFPEDVLSAIAGLANAISRKHHCTYRSGLWLEDLQVGLAWYVSNQHLVDQTNGLSTKTFLANDTLPSWSWASCWNRSIRLRGWWPHTLVENWGVQRAEDTSSDEAIYRKQSLDLKWKTSIPSRGTKIRIQNVVDHMPIVEVQEGYKDGNDQDLSGQGMNSNTSNESWFDNAAIVTPQAPDKCLKVGGYVKLGRIGNYTDLGPRNEVLRDSYDGDHRSWLCDIEDPATGQNIGYIALDMMPSAGTKFYNIHCLLCTVREKDGEWQLTALGLVQESAQSSNFKRIGLVFVRKEDWFGPLSTSPSEDFARREQIDRAYQREFRTLTLV